MKKFSLFLILTAFCSGLFAFDSYMQAANRKTAVRCLKLAESFLSSKDYGNALSQSDLGLSYDPSVSDLWYIQAVSKLGLGEKRAVVIELVRKSILEGEWVDYNRDNARIFYADLLCDTDNYNEALSILDAKPFIYSADSEFIRLKTYYRSGTEENLVKAREKVDAARKIYPSDKRFAELFFRHEYALKLKKNKEKLFNVNSFESEIEEASDELVQKIADSFIAKMPEYDNPDAELEIYASLFASGEQQKRMLQAFTAHGMEHPLYAKAAFEAGLVNQQEAWDYFCMFADKSVDLWMLMEIVPELTDDVTRESIKEHLNAYEGILKSDTDGDLEPNLIVQYTRGRAKNIQFDANNDGILEYSCECDFGVPVDIDVDDTFKLTYGTYPAIIRAELKNPFGDGNIVYSLIDESLDWTPFLMEPLEVVRKSCGYDFFVPFPDDKVDIISEDDFKNFCSKSEIPTDERQNGKIIFTWLNGEIKSGEYDQNGVPYAYSVFQEGKPYSRNIDNDGDGIFEVTEIYGYDPENKNNISVDEEKQIMKNLTGADVAGTGLYVKLIQIDSNGDTVPDFTEQYDVNGGKVSMWDTDSDGNWDVRYRKYPQASLSDPVYEDSQFYRMPEHSCVTITYANSVPVKVSEDEMEYDVIPGVTPGFYWVGEAGNFDDESYILENYSGSLSQGKTEIIQKDNRRMNVVKVADNLYAEFLGEMITTDDDFYTDSLDGSDSLSGENTEILNQ